MFAAVLACLALGCVSWRRWTTTGHVAEWGCGEAVGVRPASDALDDWALTVEIRAPLAEPCENDGGRGKP